MNADERKTALYNMLVHQKHIQIAQLAEYFGVSPMTIRRDVCDLEKAQMVERSHGKVHIKISKRTGSSFAVREVENLVFKQDIAKTAISFLHDMDSIYIDGSTTCNELVKMLPNTKCLTVFTSNVASLQILRNMGWINTFAIGGFLASDMTTLDGDMAIKTAKNIFVDAAFISCSGFSSDGVVNNDIAGCHVRKVMLENSQKRFLLADHSKYNSRGMFLFGTWDKFDYFITDQPLSEKDTDVIKKLGVEIVCE